MRVEIFHGARINVLSLNNINTNYPHSYDLISQSASSHRKASDFDHKIKVYAHTQEIRGAKKIIKIKNIPAKRKGACAS